MARAREHAISTVVQLDARRRLLAILAADAAGYSRLMAIDDHETVQALDSAREVFRSGIVLQGGRVIDMAGDSVLAVFDTAAGAVRAAMLIQAELARLGQALPTDRRLQFRIGVHLGDVIEKADGTVYGEGVNVAARLQALAQPGNIVVSQAIQSAVSPRVQATFVDLGEHAVKNIAQPVRAFACAASEPGGKGQASGAVAFAALAAWPAGVTMMMGARRTTLVVAAAALFVIFAIVAGWFALQQPARPADPAPYSAADRRLTFAVLPVEAPKGDARGEQLALSIGETVQALEEERILWAKVVPRPLVRQVAATPASLRKLGSALDVHFLLRATVARAATGYSANLAVIDAETEVVLDSVTLTAEPSPDPKVKRSDIDDALSALTFKALRAEVARARSKPDPLLDVRDLSLRAYADWQDGGPDPAAVYATAQRNLVRALALAPDDLLALRVSAEVNLCECARAWARGDRLEELVKVGTKALDRYLELSPSAPYMLYLRSRVFLEHQHYDEAILVADEVLRQDPGHESALRLKANALLELRRLPEALAAAQAATAVADNVYSNGLVARIEYLLRNDAAAVQYATKAISKMPARSFAEPVNGQVVLLLAAAQARLGKMDRAKAALKDFYAAVPEVQTIAQMKAWLHYTPDPDDEEFFAGLRRAGVNE